MKRLIITALLIIDLLLPGVVAFASDITDAQYETVITVTNNSTTDYSGIIGELTLSVPDMISNGMLNASGSDVTIQRSGAVDVPFMPGYSTNPWCVFVPSSYSQTVQNYNMYHGGVTGGLIRYFPDIPGMTIPYNPSLALGNNFEITINDVFLDTDNGTGKYIMQAGALKVYESDTISGDITAIIGSSVNITDSESSAKNTLYSSNANYATAHNAATGGTIADIRVGQRYYEGQYMIYRSMLIFNTAILPDDAIIDNAIIYLNYNDDDTVTDFNVIITNGMPTYPHNPLQTADYAIANYSGNGGSMNTTAWAVGLNSIELNDTGLSWISNTGVSKFALLSSRDIASTTPTADEWITATKAGSFITICYTSVSAGTHVTVAGISIAEHDNMVVSANTTHLVLAVGATSNSIALGGASVPDKGNDYYLFENNSVMYAGKTTVEIAGVPVSAWEWEYGATFADSIGSNDAIPSFRTAGSTTDVILSIASQDSTAEQGEPYVATGGGWSMIDSVPTAPGELFTEGGTTFPGYAEIDAFATGTRMISTQGLLYIIAFVTAGMGLLGVFAKTHNSKMGNKGSLFLGCFTAEVILMVWVFAGGGVISGLVLIPFGLISILWLLIRNPFSPITS